MNWLSLSDVSLRGVNFGFLSRLGCSGQSANILRSHLGFHEEHRITWRETEVKFSFFFFFFIFKRSLWGQNLLKSRPDGLDHVSYGGRQPMYRSIYQSISRPTLDQVSVEYRLCSGRCSVDISVEYPISIFDMETNLIRVMFSRVFIHWHILCQWKLDQNTLVDSRQWIDMSVESRSSIARYIIHNSFIIFILTR